MSEKQVPLSTEYKKERREVWLTVVTAVATANDCKKPAVAISWADKILDAYDERFLSQAG